MNHYKINLIYDNDIHMIWTNTNFYRKPPIIPMEHHYVQWTNPLFLWWFSTAMLNYQWISIFWLVVWNIFYFSIYWLGIVLPTDEPIFQRVGSTTNQVYNRWIRVRQYYTYYMICYHLIGEHVQLWTGTSTRTLPSGN